MHESDAALFHHQGNARKIVLQRPGTRVLTKRLSEQSCIVFRFQAPLLPMTMIRIERRFRQVRHHLRSTLVT
jgi:hypothetical protein